MAAKYKVVSLGKFGGGPMTNEEKELGSLDTEIILAPKCTTEDELIAATKDADAILGGSPFFTQRVMEALPKCIVIATYSVGYNTIDIAAATENNILVVNNPAYCWCVEEVSNHALTLLLASAKKLTIQNDLTKQGRWADAKQTLPPMAPIHGQTLGIVGCGDIGRMTARKAHCFGLRLLGYDPYVDRSLAEESGITLVSSLPKLLNESDFISIHTFLNEETWHLIGEEEFNQMKPTAYFINTARGPNVDEGALIKALQEKKIAGAGLDVFETEPIDPNNPLLKMDNVIVVPHSASYSDTAVEVNSINPAQEVARVLCGKWPNNPVNETVKPKIHLV
ncbi:C-terminal binding protein [Chloroflexota bacterium]